jgi:hypothetical protein
VVDQSEPEGETDLRRRAAWLLGMLAVVAVLFVVVLTAVIGTDSGGNSRDRPGSLDGAISSHTTKPSSSHHSTQASRSTTKASSSASSTTPHGTTSCPSKQTCILDGDVGNGVEAINAYRTQHGKSAVPGSVSTTAQQCAVHNGSGCSGGWAETELAKADGPAAVQKILPFAHLLDSNVKQFEVGWAYDPGAKLYYFAILRKT